MERFPGGYIISLISEYLETLGYECISYDKYRDLSVGNKAFLITDIATKKNTTILDNLVPLIAFSLESPLYSTLYYSNITWYSRRYITLMDWKGVSTLHPQVSTKLVPMKWPCYRNENIQHSPKINNRLSKVVFISTNKKPFQFSPPNDTLFKKLKYTLAFFYTMTLKVTRTFRSMCLYKDKMKVLKHLLDFNLIDIYGRGWDTCSLFRDYRSHFKGPVADKHAVISKYKFSLCIENMKFPGYLTEKIYDALFAYTIPIYLGDPDIDKQIPENCYIDLRKFVDYQDLISYLENMPRPVFDDYIQSIKMFVDTYEKKTFTCQKFGELIADKVEEYL